MQLVCSNSRSAASPETNRLDTSDVAGFRNILACTSVGERFTDLVSGWVYQQLVRATLLTVHVSLFHSLDSEQCASRGGGNGKVLMLYHIDFRPGSLGSSLFAVRPSSLTERLAGLIGETLICPTLWVKWFCTWLIWGIKVGLCNTAACGGCVSYEIIDSSGRSWNYSFTCRRKDVVFWGRL